MRLTHFLSARASWLCAIIVSSVCFIASQAGGAEATSPGVSKDPLRLKRQESFLGIHFDFHAGPDCKEIGRNTTPEMVENIIDLVHPDYLQIDCKGHRGLSSYPTKAGNQAPGFVGDPLRIWREVTARRGVSLYMHYSGVWDSEAIIRHPDWGVINANGTTNGNATSFWSPYADQLLIPQLRELAGDYGVDGAWIDGECWASVPDYGEAASSAFRQATGIDRLPRGPGEPNWFEFLQFNREAFRGYLRHYIADVKRTNPEFQLCSNWAFTDHMPEAVCAPVDFLSGDYSPEDSVNSARLSARYLARQGKPWDLMAWSFTIRPKPGGRTQKTAVQLEREAAVVLAMGGGFQAYHKQKRDGSIFPEQMAVMAEVAKFCRVRQSFCHRAGQVPQVALLYSTSAHYRKINGLFSRDLARMNGTLQALLESQQSVEVLSEHHLAGRMAEYPLIVVPECEYLEPSFKSELLRYVEAGGNLLLIGPKSAALFQSELDVVLEGKPETNPRALSFYGEWARTRDEVQAVTLGGNARAFGLVHMTNDFSSASQPAASIASFGKGKIAATYFAFGQGYLAERSDSARRFLDELTRQLFPNRLVEVSGSRDVDVVVNRVEGRLAINLINTAGPHQTEPILESIRPVGPLALAIRGPKPARITLQPDGKDLPFEYEEGKVKLTVPRLEIHDIVVVEPSDATRKISLAGPWRFALDRQDFGLKDEWADRRLEGQIRLPGTLAGQGIGDEISLETPWTGSIVDTSYFTAPEYAPYRETGNIKVPFWLQPEKYYAGPAWFQKDIEIPESWAGQRIVLSLERPHWESRVWVDGRHMGTNLSLSTPHEHDLGALSAGPHTISVRIDNRLVIDVGRDSHSVSDHTQGNWNGVAGALELRTTPRVWIGELGLYPRVADRSVVVRGRIGNSTGQRGEGKVIVSIRPLKEPSIGSGAPVSRRECAVDWQPDGGAFECELTVPGAALWDEFDPNLFVADVMLESGPESWDTRTARFGFREFTTQGTQFAINGRPTFIRGTLECAIFPKTGHPPTDLGEWRRIIRVAKSHGLNNLRFHSWCPPEAAFDAADELGMYLHVECASWANASTTLGDGRPVDAWVYAEADNILRAYGNHPSFVMMLYGNEPGGGHHKEFLSKWLAHYREADPRRLYSGGAGWPELPENQFHVTPEPRIQAWGGGLKSRINALPPETRTDYSASVQARSIPVVSHEIGQWCVYPNFDELAKYTGYLKPRNFEIFRDTLAAHGLSSQARPFLLASGKLQTLCYKEDIESALRTPGMGGFQLLDLHDFPGQGTALVGVLDPFWEEKGYVSPAEYHRFCGPTVPLARFEKRVFTQDEETTIGLEIAHFGSGPLRGVWPVFKLLDDHGTVRMRGNARQQDIEMGNGKPLYALRQSFRNLSAPARYKFVFGLARDQRSEELICENDWDLWVYPEHVETPVPDAVTIVHELNDDTLAKLNDGGAVVWLISPSRVAGDKKLGKIELGFSSIFWNTAWTRRQAPHTLGVLCDPGHPLLEAFPTDSHSNWQWWYLVTRAAPMILDDIPRGLGPIVQVIDDWFTARKLGLVFEATIGTGRLLVCSIDLDSDAETNPVVRQFRHSLYQYAASDRFQPAHTISPDALRKLTMP